MTATQESFLDAPTPERKGEYAVPVGGDVEACRSCGAEIVWARTAKGTAIPLSLATLQRRGGAAYCLSHFTDCPEAREWSKR